MKLAHFSGDSLKVIREFPAAVRRKVGFELALVQREQEPTDWKPMSSIGPGVREIRIRVGRAFRVIYVTNIGDAVHVLHAFEKNTQKTPKRDIDLAKQRLKDIMQDR